MRHSRCARPHRRLVDSACLHRTGARRPPLSPVAARGARYLAAHADRDSAPFGARWHGHSHRLSDGSGASRLRAHDTRPQPEWSDQRNGGLGGRTPPRDLRRAQYMGCRPCCRRRGRQSQLNQSRCSQTLFTAAPAAADARAKGVVGGQQSGNSCGSNRQAQQLRTTWQMACNLAHRTKPGSAVTPGRRHERVQAGELSVYQIGQVPPPGVIPGHPSG